MATVKIDTPGVTVEVTSDDTLHVVSAQAFTLFHAAGGWPQPTNGPAIGFGSERRPHPSYDSTGKGMWHPPGEVQG